MVECYVVEDIYFLVNIYQFEQELNIIKINFKIYYLKNIVYS